MKQTERILKYMHDFGSITQLEAMQDIGCMRLAARIADLKRDGHAIRREMETSYARYRLVE